MAASACFPWLANSSASLKARRVAWLSTFMSEPSQSSCASPLLDVEMLSLFPEIFDSFLRPSLVGKAIEGGIVRVACTNPRDFARGRHRQVDDASYGGGPGLVLRPEALAAAIEAYVRNAKISLQRKARHLV